MRNAARRLEKYSKKISGMVIPGQASRYAPTAAERIKLEAIVRQLGAPPMLAFSYLAFAEQLWKIKKKYQGDTAFNEAQAIAAGWLTRGLTESNLLRIGRALNLGNVVTPTTSLHERYIINDDSFFNIWGTRWGGQTLTVGNTGVNENHTITSVKLKLFRAGNPGLVTVSIRAVDGANKPVAPDLSTGTTDGNTLPVGAPYEWRDVTMSAFVLQANIQYAIVVRSAGADVTNTLNWATDGTAPTYAGGQFWYSTTSGATWLDYATDDAMFEEWGYST